MSWMVEMTTIEIDAVRCGTCGVILAHSLTPAIVDGEMTLGDVAERHLAQHQRDWDEHGKVRPGDVPVAGWKDE